MIGAKRKRVLFSFAERRKGAGELANFRPAEKTAYIRSRVLPAAAKLYLEKGFSRTTIRDIAAASGITVALIMTVMKSKEDILSELVTFVLESQFSAAEAFLDGTDYDPFLFYAAETTLQLYMAESGEGVRNLYAAAYSMPKTTAIIQNTITDKLLALFGAYHPEWTRGDFYLREIASGGIMRDFMAHPCTQELSMERKVAAFLETTFLVYRVPDETIEEAIRFVSRFDYPALAHSTVQAMLRHLDEAMTSGT